MTFGKMKICDSPISRNNEKGKDEWRWRNASRKFYQYPTAKAQCAFTMSEMYPYLSAKKAD